jgi:putative intracellular protease/amidase
VATVQIPLPDQAFDVTEVAVPWRLLVNAGHTVVFATASGTAPATGRGDLPRRAASAGLRRGQGPRAGTKCGRATEDSPAFTVRDGR